MASRLEQMAQFSDSWDPRTWVAQSPPAGLLSQTSSVASSETAGAPDRRLLIAGAAALGILVMGAVGAALSRPDSPEAADLTAGQGATQLASNEVQRILPLATLADLPDALTTNGISASDAAAAEAAARQAFTVSGQLRAVLTIRTGPEKSSIVQLELSNPDSSGAIITPAGVAFEARPMVAQLTKRVIVRNGRMDADSFYSSAVAAGITDSLVSTIAAALAFDFDFQREVRAGDAFEAAFEQGVNAQGEPVGPPKLLFVSLTTETKSAAVYRFEGAGEDGEWFDASGRSIVRAFMRTPVDGARVSSQFGFRRHPILGFQKLHRGTDFAAPTGTSIFASGNAVVTFAGPKGANGNFVRLRHDNGWDTLYLHMNRIALDVKPGVRVRQGQIIGEVGTTGRSTGPHLHYEVHLEGEPVDPLSIQVDEGRTLAGPHLIAFGKVREKIDFSRAGSMAGSGR